MLTPLPSLPAGRSTVFCPRGSPLPRRKLLARCQPWGEALGSIQTSCSAPTGDVGCCPGGCGTGSVKGSARAVLIVLRIRSMAARPASLFGREKAGTGAMRVSRSHARLETRTRAQAVNARGRREGKGGWGWLGLDSEGTQRGSQAETRRTMSLPAVQRHRVLCCIS